MGRRGFLALLVHQSQVAARERVRAQRAAVREHNAALRRAHQAQRAAESLTARLAKATAAELKKLQKEAKEAHVAAMEAAVEERNLGLQEIYSEIDSLLQSTLEVDDYFDLERLRQVVEHPPFPRPDLEQPTPLPSPIPDPPKPVYVMPDPPSGMLATLFGKKKHAQAIADTREVHERNLASWQAEMNELPAKRRQALEAHSRAEMTRIAALEAEREKYQGECVEREARVAEHNRRLESFVANLGYGTPEAVQEYISIVLSNSVYPDHFAVKHEFQYEPQVAELRLRVSVPGPDAIPQIKEYKYTKSKDEISEIPLPQKACKERYSGAIHQVALRSIHEVFEADRRNLVKTISLELGADTIDPSTGRREYIPFVAVAAERETFLKFDLSAVVPAMTLTRLGAAMSKNPFALEATDAKGVRRS